MLSITDKKVFIRRICGVADDADSDAVEKYLTDIGVDEETAASLADLIFLEPGTREYDAILWKMDDMGTALLEKEGLSLRYLGVCLLTLCHATIARACLAFEVELVAIDTFGDMFSELDKKAAALPKSDFTNALSPFFRAMAGELSKSETIMEVTKTAINSTMLAESIALYGKDVSSELRETAKRWFPGREWPATPFHDASGGTEARPSGTEWSCCVS